MKNYKLKKFLHFLEILIVGYGFLSLCNWNINIAEWSGISHFVSAAFILITYATLRD